MAQSSERDVKIALTSLKAVMETINQRDLDSQTRIAGHENQGQLQMMLRKIRVSKLSQVFIEKLGRSNVFNKPTNHHLLSQRELDQKRLLKWKGFTFDPRIISVVYLLDIIFCLITFVTGSFRAFIEIFTTSGDRDSVVFLILMIIAIIVTSFKVIFSSLAKTIQEGVLLVYLTDILRNYITNSLFFIDLAYVGINIALLILKNDSEGLSIALFIVSLLKLFTLYDNLRTFETTYINSFRREQYFNLLKVALFNIFFAHFVCSMLLAMSLRTEQNWRSFKGIDQQPWYVQYIWAFYWACTIIMTVGFGDFSAFYFKEAIIVAFLQLFSCIVLAYNISEIGNIISAIRTSQIQFRRKIAIFKRMANENQIDVQLQRRIEAYLREETNIKETFEFNQQNQLLDEIPQNLRNEYIVEANKNVFPDLPFFKNLQKNTLVNLTEKFKGKVFYPGEYLMKLEEGNDSIMILKTGTVGLAYKKYGSFLNGTIVQEVSVEQKQVLLSDGSFENKMTPVLLNTDFLSQTKKINYDIIAQNYSFVYLISYADFYEVIKTSEIDASYFFSIHHKHSIVQNEWEQIICEYCSKEQKDSEIYDDDLTQKQRKSRAITALDTKKYHSKFSCPKLHYFPLSGIVVLKSIKNQGIEQLRDEGFYRRKKRQPTSLVRRKNFFKIYEKSRNLSSLKKLKQQKKKDLQKDFMDKYLKLESEPSNVSPTKDDLMHEQYLTIEKVVREAIEEALTGYKPQFWDLEIDILYNYTNYFPLDNSKNLDFANLNRGREKSAGANLTGDRKRTKTILNFMKQLDIYGSKGHI